MKHRYYFLTVIFAVLFVQIGFAQTPINVRGKLIHIFTAAANGPVYPNGQPSDYDDFFGTTIPVEINGHKFATSVPEAGVGATQFSGDAGRYVFAAVHSKSIVTSAWIDLNISFTMSTGSNPQNTYYLFKRNISNTGAWYNVPQQTVGNAPTLLFADQGDIKWVDFTPPAGNIIAERTSSSGLIVDPSICVLPNGNMMALAKGVTGTKKQFRSTDGGLTWQGFGPDNIQIRFATPFTHNGVLYMLSSFDYGGANGIFIRKSLDNGTTWEMYNGNNYVVLNSTVLNGALNCPSPVVVSNGRIWRAMGDNGPDDAPNLGFMSASVNADLMNPSNWTFSNTIVRASSVGRIGGILKPFEPCAVATRNGFPAILSRTRPASGRNGDAVPIYRSTSATNLTFNQNDVIDFPGALVKFCVQYDPVSDRYWAMSNRTEVEDIGTGDVIPENRRTLVLMSSIDLIDWKVEHVMAQGEEEKFHGYQYPFFVIEGNDLITAVRTSGESENGLPIRSHDANYLTFHRVTNFRNFLNSPEVVRMRKGWDVIYVDGQNTIAGGAVKIYSTPVNNSNEWVQIDLNNGYLAYQKAGTDLVLQGGATGGVITLQPFDFSNQNQQWKKIKIDFRHSHLEKRNAPGSVIDGGGSTEGQGLTLQAVNNSNQNQNWEFETTTTPAPVVSNCSIIPYIQVNGGAWNNVGSVSVTEGDQVSFGPQSQVFGDIGGNWSYSGPNGYTYSGRAPVLTNIQLNQAGTYIVTNTDQNGCTTTYNFTITVNPSISQIGIIVDGTGFTNRAFTNGTELFTNRTHFIQNAPVAFSNFQFAASDGGSIQTGDIIPTANGYVYVIASNITDLEWELVPDSAFTYSDFNQTSVSIYRHVANAYVPVAIPNVTSFPGATPIASSVQVGIPAVQVQGAGFTKRDFVNGTLLFNNRTYVVQNAPAAFADYEFVTSDGGSIQTGTITSPVNGFVYVIATSVTDAGWSLVPNSTFNYSDGTPTSVSIYQHTATANVPVAIPNVTSFAGASPLAKVISLNGSTAKKSLSKPLILDENDSIEGESLVVYPNPASEEFNIKLVGGEKTDVSIFNLEGSLLYNQKDVEGELSIKNHTFKTGVYIIKVNSESGKSHIKKLIIK
jgi:hypothetical protein